MDIGYLLVHTGYVPKVFFSRKKLDIFEFVSNLYVSLSVMKKLKHIFLYLFYETNKLNSKGGEDLVLLIFISSYKKSESHKEIVILEFKLLFFLLTN